ncbi:MAG: hypothetical protein JF595_07850 [Sphingomonadales bacterium]|nr:hypothetical protein [Sphingomonadales bacterium]
MRKIALALATGAALLAGSAVAAKPKLSGEEQLAKVLQGRVPGKPVDCISLFDSRDQQVIDKTAIVYGNGRTIYVNRPSNAHDLDRDDIMVVNIHGSELCNLDIVRTHERSGGFYNGFVGLQQFVPYRRVASAN